MNRPSLQIETNAGNDRASHGTAGARLRRQLFKNASKSALIVAASVVGMPCGKPL
jgi:hypothetical protein